MRRFLVNLACLAALLLAAAPAHAKAERGKPAPDFKGKSFLNTKAFDLKSLRGKVVVLQLAHTASEPCKEQVAKLIELEKKHGEKGLVVVCLFEERKGDVEKFLKENKAGYRAVAECRKMRERFGLKKGFPTTLLVDPDGKVAWIGNFADRAEIEIGVLMAKVSSRPWLPDKYAEINKYLDASQFVEAQVALDAALAAEGLEAEDKKRLEAVAAWLGKVGRPEMEEADKLRGEAKIWEARNAYREVVKRFPGLPVAKEAQKRIDEFLANKTLAREIEAGDYLLEIYPQAQELEKESPKKAAKLLKKVVKKYKDTRAAEKAQLMIDRLDP